MSIITIGSVIILLIPSVLIMPVTTSLTPRGRSRAVSRLDCICCNGSTVDPIPRLRNSGILVSRRPEQRSDLQQAPASLRLGGLNRFCYMGRDCQILNWGPIYLRRREELTSTGLGSSLTRLLVEYSLEILQSSALGQVSQARVLQGPGLGGLSDDRSAECIRVPAAKLLSL